MRQRLVSRWLGLQDSLWLLPAIMTVCATVVALVIVQVDNVFWDEGAPRGLPLIFGGGAEGARGVLSSIAGSLVTVTGTVFSITIVTLQLATGQMSPRVLRTFTGDRIVQVTLGTLISTFTYTLLVLRTVRREESDYDAFVPAIATTLAIGLALASVGMLIAFVSHVARTIQVSVVIDRTTADTHKLIDRRFPDTVAKPADEPLKREHGWPPPGPHLSVTAAESGYLQSLAEDQLLVNEDDAPVTIAVRRSIGDFVLAGSEIARVWPMRLDQEAVEKRVRSAFVFGPERTLQSDIGLGIRQITDIAIKALSPSINDPTTAIICIDRLCELLVDLANREPPNRFRTDGEGKLALMPAPTFAELTSAAFDQVRLYGSHDSVVMAHLITALSEVADVAPIEHQQPLTEQARLAQTAAHEALTLPADIARVDKAAAWLPPNDAAVD